MIISKDRSEYLKKNYQSKKLDKNSPYYYQQFEKLNEGRRKNAKCQGCGSIVLKELYPNEIPSTKNHRNRKNAWLKGEKINIKVVCADCVLNHDLERKAMYILKVTVHDYNMHRDFIEAKVLSLKIKLLTTKARVNKTSKSKAQSDSISLEEKAAVHKRLLNIINNE